MDLKKKYDAGDKEEECEICEAYEEENTMLREQAEKQGLVIEKLSKAQELLMMQYKVMELGLNKELEAIEQTQSEIDTLKGGSAPPQKESNEEEQDKSAEKEE